MVTVTVEDGLIDKVTLYREATWFLRLDVWPFLIVYAAGLAASMNEAHVIKLAGLIAVPIGLGLHLLLFLFAQSSVHFRCWIGKSSAKDLSEASWVHVQAAKNAGKDRLVPVLRGRKISPDTKVSVLSNDFPLSNEFFQYQEVTYYYDAQVSPVFELYAKFIAHSIVNELFYGAPGLHLCASRLPHALLPASSDGMVWLWRAQCSRAGYAQMGAK